MAHTAHSDEKMMEELRDSPQVVSNKAKELADAIRSAKHVVIFTGAGISTAAGIADYRGPNGVWTLEAKGEGHKIRSVNMTAAVPTPAHMAMVELVRRGLVHHVISQNVDGLHRKSGIPKERLSELHGNNNIEYCSSCRREYLRDFTVQAVKGGRPHETGRQCIAAGCQGKLHDTIINFGESLPIETVAQAFSNSEQADLFIVLGSSLTVAPASDMPRSRKQEGKLAIVNLQRTKQDSQADIRVHGGINEFLEQVMLHLDIPIPPFRLHRAAALWRPDDAGALHCAAIDSADRAPATLFKQCTFIGKDGSAEHAVEADHSGVIFKSPSLASAESGKVRCTFFQHYGEPDIELSLPAGRHVQHFDLFLDPLQETAWTLNPIDETSIPSPDEILPGKGGAAMAQVRTAGTGAAHTPADTTDYSGWFAVQPVDDCPHTSTGVASADHFHFDPKAPCTTCQNIGENMMCLSCHSVFCGRHVQQHMLDHHKATDHPIVCGFVDLSFWCYKCDEYIKPTNRKLLPYYAAMHTAKFGVPPPGCAGCSAVEQQPSSAAAASQADMASSSQPLDGTIDQSGWFAVQPVDDCPHTASGISSPHQLHCDLSMPCATCKNVGENMLCMSCHAVFCGRHVQQHMLAHHDATGHPIVCGFADLSFWCYECEEYLKPTNRRVSPYYAALHTARFGALPPGFGPSR